jgi:hypothetical protein
VLPTNKSVNPTRKGVVMLSAEERPDKSLSSSIIAER